MYFKLSLLSLFCLLVSCSEKKPTEPIAGTWRAEMEVMDNQMLPFNFTWKKVNASKSDFKITVFNSDERFVIDDISLKNDSIYIRMPVFEGFIAGTFTPSEIRGQFIKESLERSVPFVAKYDNNQRFINTNPTSLDLSGIWKTKFTEENGETYMAKGTFYQEKGKLTGTFRTTTGDYRYLEGTVDGDSLKLSTFDGAHVFLFLAKANDSTLSGNFYSGNHYKATFEATRDDAYELPDASSLTYLKEGYDKFEFSFPDSNDELISLSDAQFENKVVLVQIMGTWCPNCLDETNYYVEYLKENPNKDLKFVALAFEYARTKEKAMQGINRLKDRVGVPYPILLAQIGTSSKTKANEKLPMLNQVLSYPTTIYIDKKGVVRKIHTGFNGPATGEKYEEFKEEFKETLATLLAE